MIVQGIMIVLLSAIQPRQRMGTNNENATRTSARIFLTSGMQMVEMNEDAPKKKEKKDLRNREQKSWIQGSNSKYYISLQQHVYSVELTSSHQYTTYLCSNMYILYILWN